MTEAYISMQETILQYASLFHLTLCLTDTNNTVQLAVGDEREWFFSTKLEEYAYVNRVWDVGENPQSHLLCVPVTCHERLKHLLYVRCGRDQDAAHIAQAVRIALEGILNMREGETSEKPNTVSSRSSLLAHSLLSGQLDANAVDSLMHRFDLDGSLIRAVICIDLTFEINRYFNINLNLGYLPLIEQARAEIIAAVRNNKYLNAQDISASYRENEIVIIKSFVPTADVSRIYLALTHICEDVLHSIEGQYLLNIKGAFGNIYTSAFDLSKSYEEARELIEIGKQEMPALQLYSLENLLTSIIFQHLPARIVNKIVLPMLQKLKKAQPKTYMELIRSCEVFIDCCMNFSKSATILDIHRNTLNARLYRVQQITDMDPINKFKDALALKLLALYIRQNAAERRAQSDEIQ